jgi:hypothetical protein
MTKSAGEIYALASRFGARWPELVVAQWHLESSQGTALSGKHNYFGLKGKGSRKQTVEYINGKPITINDAFLDFHSTQECVRYLVDRWYRDWNSHNGVNNAKSAESAARMLQSEGYATDPQYANKLIRVMTQYGNLRNSMTTQSLSNRVDLVDVPENFKGLDHQIKALRELNDSLTPEQYQKFTKTWRSNSDESTGVRQKFPLAVPYFYQRDSKTGHGERMCQSSAIAMRIEQIDPKILRDDDSYLSIVQRFGDTVSQTAHQKALSYLGLKHQFRQNGTEKMLCELLDRGIAAPIGILHKGSIASPTGGGHWITLIGYDEKFFHCHDPFGELDLLNGGYTKTGPTDGKNQRYTRKNLMKRWLIASQSDGWLWVIER